MAWFREKWNWLGERSRHYSRAAREKFRNIKWRRPSNPVLIWTGAVVAVLALSWVVLNLLLANPSTGTPMVNWALRTFGDKNARVLTGHLEHPFSSKLVLRTLEWPRTLKASTVDLRYDLFGFLPGRVWISELRVVDGELRLDEQQEGERGETFSPQEIVDRIDIRNVDIKFTRNNHPRTVRIVAANGAFSDGSVRAEATAGDNHLFFEGLQRNFGGALEGQVAASGQNMKDLADIVGASAPDTPPYDVRGALMVQDLTWSISDLSGKMGDSDLSGLVRINVADAKPFLTVDLKSERLDFDDLGVVFGIPVGTGKGETTNEEQVMAKAAFDRSARLIPDARIDFSRLAAVNADITFAAAKVVDAPAGITALNMKGTLRDSVLDFERAQVSSGAGDLDAEIKIDASHDPADTRATGTLSKVAINRLVDTDLIRGTLNGRFALSFTGSGFREAAATATGEAGIWSNNSELSKFAVEGAGLDLGEILLLWATEDQDSPEYIKSRCLAANIAFKAGQATLQPAVIENKDSLVAASGGVNLKTEALDIEVYARPHDVSVGTISGDIRIGGTLRSPVFEALNEETLLQAGIAGLLSSVTGALAVLPFIQTGGEPDAPCATLLADARETSTRSTPAANVKPSKDG